MILCFLLIVLRWFYAFFWLSWDDYMLSFDCLEMILCFLLIVLRWLYAFFWLPRDDSMLSFDCIEMILCFLLIVLRWFYAFSWLSWDDSMLSFDCSKLSRRKCSNLKQWCKWILRVFLVFTFAWLLHRPTMYTRLLHRQTMYTHILFEDFWFSENAKLYYGLLWTSFASLVFRQCTSRPGFESWSKPVSTWDW